MDNIKGEALDLNKLTRYGFCAFGVDFGEESNGPYVKLSDVQAALARASSAATAGQDAWISVNDRLPAPGVPVLAFRPMAEASNDPRVAIAYHCGPDASHTSPQGVAHGFKCWCHPTHWMPIPALPGESADIAAQPKDTTDTKEKGMSLSAHQKNGAHDEWLTPPEIVKTCGAFDLDPCAPIVRPWETAARHYTVEDDGLAQPWEGRVWCNPPFGREAIKWLRKMVEHGNGIALIPARTETVMFYEMVWGAADAVLFIQGRPHFHYVCGKRAAANSGAPICLVAYGLHNVAALEQSELGIVLPIIGHKRRVEATPAHPGEEGRN